MARCCIPRRQRGPHQVDAPIVEHRMRSGHQDLTGLTSASSCGGTYAWTPCSLAAPITFKNRLFRYIGRITRPHPAKPRQLHDYHHELTLACQGWVARGVAPSGSRRTRRDSLPSPGSHHLDHQGILHPGPVREAAWVALLQPLPRRTGPAISPSTSALSYSSSPRTRRGLTRRNSHRWPSPFARLPLQELHRYYGPVRRRTDHARCAFPSSMREPQTRLMPPQCRTPLGQ